MYRLPKTHKEGNPLRPILSITSSSHHELGKWLAGLLQPVLERFSSHCISDSSTFAKTMQNLDIDPNIFIFEKEKEKCPPFLDVYVERTDVGLETSVYRKPTFTGQYLRWESFSPLKRKISLISTLVHRALMICTKRRLNGEIQRIKKILLDNRYPKSVINTQITEKIAQFSTLKRFGPEKCPVYWKVPWIGKPSTNLEKEIKTAVESCYGSANTRLVFT